MDESVLTGESVPVEKGVGEEVFAGTLLVRGRALLEVTRTGAQSAMGRIAHLLAEMEEEKTPLERRLHAFGHRVARLVLLLALGLLLLGFLVEGVSAKVVLFAVALAVAAVPEGLPAVLTLALALGVERMARRKAVVRRLSAVEALGSVTVIATDKTGTLTENRMEVQELLSPDPEKALWPWSSATTPTSPRGRGIRWSSASSATPAAFWTWKGCGGNTPAFPSAPLTAPGSSCGSPLP